ncbi:MAG: Ig-like domain-containing protein, partial [Clostridia bacterium]|nr:Ig-like domain-containing protein [Clostridia bacterium]
IFAYDETKDNNFVLSAGEKLYLNALIADTFVEDKNILVEWSSNVPAVATVDQNGVVSGIKSGIVTITATNTANGKTADITIRVETKVTALILGVTTKSLEVGLAKQTVFASSKYINATDGSNHEVENNTYTVEFMRPIISSDDMYASFDFKVYENGEISNKAHFEDNVLVFDRENINGFSTLNIVIKAKYPRYATFENNTIATFDINVTDAVAVNSFVDLLRAANRNDKDHCKAICFEKNVKVFDGEDKPYNSNPNMVCARYNVYGNGFMYSAKHRQATEPIMYVGAPDVTVSNIIIRANEVGEEITTAEENVGLTGHSLIFLCNGDWGNFPTNPRLTNCRVEYCILENAKSVFQTRNTDVVIEGTIIRNSQGVGIYTQTCNYGNGVLDYSHITMRNCIMSNMLGTGANFAYSGYSGVPKEEVEKCVAEGKNLIFNQEGFLDMYNWQQTNTLNILAAAFAGDDVNPTIASLIDSAGAIISTKLEGENLMDKCSIYNGMKYFHLGFITTGLTEKSYLECHFEDDRFTSITSDDLDLGMLIGNPITLYTYGNNDQQISPASTYVVNSKLIERLHGNY